MPKVEDKFGSINIQNKEKTLFGWIGKESNPEVYREIIDVVKKSGWRETYIYLYCMLEKTGNNNVAHVVKINLSRVLPVETW